MQPTIEQLKDLKLNGLLAAWQEQHSQPTYQDLSFDERFALLVEHEYLRRQNQRLQRRLKQARLFIGALSQRSTLQSHGASRKRNSSNGHRGNG